MNRLTKLSEDGKFYVVADAGCEKNAGGALHGEAVERLARFENFFEHLLARRNAIPGEMEVLRGAGRNKTVKFRELMTEKMVNDMILTQMGFFGLK